MQALNIHRQLLDPPALGDEANMLVIAAATHVEFLPFFNNVMKHRESGEQHYRGLKHAEVYYRVGQDVRGEFVDEMQVFTNFRTGERKLLKHKIGIKRMYMRVSLLGTSVIFDNQLRNDGFSVKFNDRKSARVFLRQIKGYISRLSSRYNCHLELPQMEAFRRRLLFRTDFGDDYFSRITWDEQASEVYRQEGVIKLGHRDFPGTFNPNFICDRMNYLLNERTSLCPEDHRPVSFHDSSNSVWYYSQANDLDIINAIEFAPNSTTRLHRCSAFFEFPFNVPHPFTLGRIDKVGFLFPSVLQQPTGSQIDDFIEYNAKLQERSNDSRQMDPHLPYVPRVQASEAAMFWCFFVEAAHAHNQAGQTVYYRSLRPCLLVLPREIFLSEKITHYTTEALIGEPEPGRWRATEVFVAATESTSKYGIEFTPNYLCRWLRIVELIPVQNLLTIDKHQKPYVAWGLAIGSHNAAFAVNENSSTLKPFSRYKLSTRNINNNDDDDER